MWIIRTNNYTRIKISLNIFFFFLSYLVLYYITPIPSFLSIDLFSIIPHPYHFFFSITMHIPFFFYSFTSDMSFFFLIFLPLLISVLVFIFIHLSNLNQLPHDSDKRNSDILLYYYSMNSIVEINPNIYIF